MPSCLGYPLAFARGCRGTRAGTGTRADTGRVPRGDACRAGTRAARGRVPPCRPAGYALAGRVGEDHGTRGTRALPCVPLTIAGSVCPVGYGGYII